MKYFAAILAMKNPDKSQQLRPQHIAFLEQQGKEGTIFARGKFADGAGGLVIYKAESLEEARRIAAGDPYVAGGARSLELHEWDMKVLS